MNSISGEWIGFYSYDSQDSAPDEFEINILESDGVITGEGIDKTLKNEPFKIKGFFEGGIMSFVKTYERLIYSDEDGRIIADPNFVSVEIIYTGSYNLKRNKFEGTWEIVIEEEQIGIHEEFEVHIVHGIFELFRK